RSGLRRSGRRASTEMSENDAPVATPSRQEAVTCASIARDKAAEIAVSGSGILVAVEICPGAEGIGPKHEARPISRRWSASGLVGITKRHRLAIRAERHGLRIERGHLRASLRRAKRPGRTAPYSSPA